MENEKYRSNLLAVVSHELNTPLMGILNAITMLEEKIPGNDESISMLKRNAERLQKTISNLMEMSRVDSGALRVRLSELDLAHFIHQREKILEAALKTEGFKFQIEIEEELPRVCADLKRLSRAFDSLVHNAMKFSAPDTSHGSTKTPTIHIKLSMENLEKVPIEKISPELRAQTGMFLVLSIYSNMPTFGEAPEDFDQLFEPFSPWRDVDTREKEGLAVELALAREILHAHSGVIWTNGSATPNEGWVFHFALPVLSREDELALIIGNRLWGDLGTVHKMSLLVLRPAPGLITSEEDYLRLNKTIHKILFRTSDSVFWLPESGELTIVMDDCDEEGTKKVSARLIELMRKELPKFDFVWSLATGPDNGSSAAELLAHIRANWQVT